MADATAFDPFAKVHVGLGAIEVVGGDRDGIAGWRLRNRLGLSWVSWCSETQRRDQRGLEIAACDHGGSPFAIRCGGRYRTGGLSISRQSRKSDFQIWDDRRTSSSEVALCRSGEGRLRRIHGREGGCAFRERLCEHPLAQQTAMSED